MTNHHEYIAQLIKKRLNNSLSDREKSLLEEWVRQHPARKEFLETLNDPEELFEQVLQWVELEEKDTEDWLNKLEQSTLTKIRHRPVSVSHTATHRRNWQIYVAAASLLLVGFLVTLFVYRSFDKDSTRNPRISLQQIQPGKHQASITLPNGNVIPLSEQQKLLIVGTDQQLYYGNMEPVQAISSPFNAEDQLKLEVPRAGKYTVTLADGTIVWLNSGSTLTFPVAFAQDSRSVCLTGEAYFDVRSILAKTQQKKPFFVQTEQQRIEVKGTRFNVNAFQGEATRTTLVEGEVLVHTPLENLTLHPNEQIINHRKRLTKSTIDVKTEVAWKDNLFYFDETPLREAMNQIGRWYDVTIVYKKGVPNTYFYGEFSREQPLAEILKILQEAGVKFQYEYKNDKNNLYVVP